MGRAGEMCASIAKTMGGCTSVSKEELAKAKAQLKGNLFRQLDDDAGLVQDLGTQIMLTGKHVPAADFAKTIDGVSEADVASVAKKLLASKPHWRPTVTPTLCRTSLPSRRPSRHEHIGRRLSAEVATAFDSAPSLFD